MRISGRVAAALVWCLLLALAMASCAPDGPGQDTTEQHTADQDRTSQAPPGQPTATQPAPDRNTNQPNPDQHNPDQAAAQQDAPTQPDPNLDQHDPDQDDPDQAAPLLTLTAQNPSPEPDWQADLAVGPDGVLRYALTLDQATYACTADRYWMLGGPERNPPHFELSFRLCGCDPILPQDLADDLRPDPVLWVDLRPVDKPVATLYLFRLRPPLSSEVRHLDIEGLKRFIDEHPWEDSRKPCSTSNM